MQSDWKNWCRLCASNVSLIKLDSVQEMTRILQKYFCITLSPYQNMPDAICGECSGFIQKLDKFAEKCLRADKMFTDCILQNIQLLDNETGDFRINYGLENETRATGTGCSDQSTDTTDLETVMQIVNPEKASARPVNDETTQSHLMDASAESVYSMDTNIKIEVPEEERSVASLGNSRNSMQKLCGPNSIYEAEEVEEAEEEDLGTDEDCDNDQDLGFEINFLDDVKDDLSLDVADEQQLMSISSRPVRVKREVKPPVDQADEDDDESDHETEKKMFNFNCQTCSDEFNSYTTLAKHCMDSHSCSPRFKCVCGKNISSRTSLFAHRKLHSKEARVQLTCKLCDKIYYRQAAYELHMKAKHGTGDEKPEIFQCTKCPKSFTTEKKVKLHETVHLPDDEKVLHPCPYCEKKFTKLVNVQTHVRSIHIGERPFICEECGKSFGTKGALKEHQITHSDDRPFQCAHCPKKFKNLPRLKTHEDTHNATIYVCPHCGLQLNTKRTLKMHMVVHSDQKKYKCQFCGNEYKRSKALKNHLILHTGLRPYTCPFCDKTFANGSNCRSHKKKSHPIELAQMEASGEKSRTVIIPKLEQLQPKTYPEGQSSVLPQSDTFVEPRVKWSSSPPPPPPSTPMSVPSASPSLTPQHLPAPQHEGGYLAYRIE